MTENFQVKTFLKSFRGHKGCSSASFAEKFTKEVQKNSSKSEKTSDTKKLQIEVFARKVSLSTLSAVLTTFSNNFLDKYEHFSMNVPNCSCFSPKISPPRVPVDT